MRKLVKNHDVDLDPNTVEGYGWNMSKKFLGDVLAPYSKNLSGIRKKTKNEKKFDSDQK